MLLTPSSRLRLKLHISVALIISLGLGCTAAPVQESTEIQHYSEGCYYNYNYYNEGDRILTNEPCLNCTCHNKMLMCYLRVCPFTKPIGHDCTIEKREDQCCPIITCPEVPVELVDNQEPGTHLAMPRKHGCTVNDKYYPEGAQVPSSPSKPCELCYCIHNRTSCIMQECTLHVNGCQPIYHRNVCCPVRYNCDHDAENELVFEDEMTTTVRPTPGFILTTTLTPTESSECVHNDTIYADGELIKSDQACEHCYCMRGDIVCAVQECKLPLEKQGANCTALPAEEGDCCPSTYVCSDSDENEIIEPTDDETVFKPEVKITTELPFTVGEQTTIETRQDIHEGISEEDVQLQEHIDDKTEEEQKLDETDESNLLKGGVDTQEADESKTTPSVTDESKRPSGEHLATMSPEAGISLEQTTKKPEDEISHFEGITTPAMSPSEESTTPGIIEDITHPATTPSEGKKTPDLLHTDERTTPELAQPEEKTTPSIISPEEKTTPSIISPEEKITPAIIPSEENTTPAESTTESMPHLFDVEKDSYTTAIPKESTANLQSRFEQTTPETISYTQAPDFEDNEIVPISIPGEGDCLADGVTYRNNTLVPPANACDTNCLCLSSVVICTKIKCEEPPSPDCKTVESDLDSCCPTYNCESKIDEDELYQQMTTKKYKDISLEDTDELTTRPTTAGLDSSTEGEKLLLPGAESEQMEDHVDMTTVHEVNQEFQSESLMTVSPHKVEKEKEATTAASQVQDEETKDALPGDIESTELRIGAETPEHTTEQPVIPVKHVPEEQTVSATLAPQEADKEADIDINFISPTDQKQPSHEVEDAYKPDQTEQEIKTLTTASPLYSEEGFTTTDKMAGAEIIDSHPVTEYEGAMEQTISPAEHGTLLEGEQPKLVEEEVSEEAEPKPITEESPIEAQTKLTAVEPTEETESKLVTEESPIEVQTKPTGEEPFEKAQAATEGSPAESQPATEGSPAESQASTEGAPAESQAATEGSPAESKAATEESSTESQAATERYPAESQAATEGSPAESQAATEGSPPESQAATEVSPAESQAATEGYPAESQAATEGSPAESHPKPIAEESPEEIQTTPVFEEPSEEAQPKPAEESPEESQPKPISEESAIEAQTRPTTEESPVETQTKSTAEEAPVEAQTKSTSEESPIEAQTEPTAEESSEEPHVKPISEESSEEQDQDESIHVPTESSTPSGDYQTEKPVEELHKDIEIPEGDVYASTSVAPVEKETQTEGIISGDSHTEASIPAQGTEEPAISSPLYPVEDEKKDDIKYVDELEDHDVFIPSEETTDTSAKISETTGVPESASTSPQSIYSRFDEKPTEAPSDDSTPEISSDKITTSIEGIFGDLEPETHHEPEAGPEAETAQEAEADHEPSIVVTPKTEVDTTEESFEATISPDSKLPSKDFSRKEESTITTESSIEMKPFEVTGYPISEQPEIPFVGDLVKENETEVDTEHEKLDQEAETPEEATEEESLRKVITEAAVSETTEGVSSISERVSEKIDDVKDAWQSSSTPEPTTISDQGPEKEIDVKDMIHSSSTSAPTTEPSQMSEITQGTTTEEFKIETSPSDIISEIDETTQPSVHLMQPSSTQKPERDELTTESGDLITHYPQDKYATESAESSTPGIKKEEEIVTYQPIEATTLMPSSDVRTTSKFNLTFEDIEQSTKDSTYQTTEGIDIFQKTSLQPTKEATELIERFGEDALNKTTPSTTFEGVKTTTPSLLEILSTEVPQSMLSETQAPMIVDRIVTEHPTELPSSTEIAEHIEDGDKLESLPKATEKPINATAENDIEKPESNRIPPQGPKQPTYGQLPPQYPSYSEDDYTEEDEGEVFGPGTCRYGGKLFVSAQQIPRDDPCDFCFCFRSDIICLQQSCPPPISGCHEEPIHGFCCPRYECPVSMGLDSNSTTTTTTSTTLPPHFLHHAYRGLPAKNGCHIQGKSYKIGDKIDSASGPCMHCSCGGDGQMKCEPKTCTPEPMLRQMIAVVASRRR